VATEIRPAPLDAVREIRHVVLRPHQRPDEIVYEHDADADALHLGAYVDGALVAIASLTREPPPRADDPTAWRVRGMATLPAHRDRGLGGELLERCIEHARERGGTWVWLNGRVPASRFYERHGFAARGHVFEPPHLGPHREFRRDLR
jgi:GNAT superfamily N-acetyltransferase